MSTDRRTAKDIFVELISNVPPQEWENWLEQSCQGNDELRNHVRVLLRAHAQPGSFLEQPAVVANATGFHESPISERPGTIIGPYKLLEQIGEGGMGVVFMAEQTKPIQRTVALKIIKPGMDTRQVIARFEAERQALAMMDHPNIAKVLDAGTTEGAGRQGPGASKKNALSSLAPDPCPLATSSGRPYFVMDLVKGVPITTYCDQQHLSVRERLELIGAVCHAVQHAHQKGIIHRDIKPTNVLVAEYDGKPVPKIIDFGVAKATAQKLTERTMFTEFGQVIGTVEYMSPEQARFNQLDIDTRSDIYSLGVLLYELLTGSTPIERKRLREAAFDEVLRIIREEEPPKPSTRLSSLSLGEKAGVRETAKLTATIAANRKSEPTKLAKDLRGELDWIVMKSLEKDRNRRYETANGLSSDIERYLHDEPVQACPPSPSYRFRKFARRNKGMLTASAAVVAALLIGAVASTWQAVRATRHARAEAAALTLARANERAANENAAKAEAARQRAENSFREVRVAFKGVLADAVAGDGKWAAVPLPARKVLAEDAMRFYLKFVKESDPEPAVRFETASSLRAIALMQARVGDTDVAEKTYRRSIDTLNELLVLSPADRQYRAQLALGHRLVANLLQNGDRLQEAAESYRTAAKINEGLLDEQHHPDQLGELAWCYQGLISIDRSPQNVKNLSASILRRLEQSEGRLNASDADNATPLNLIAHFLVAARSVDEQHLPRAIELARKAIEIVPNFHGAWNILGIAQYRAGNWEAAVEALEKATSFWIGTDPVDGFYLAMAHWQLGHRDEARRRYGLAVAAIENRPADERVMRLLRAEAAALLKIEEATTNATQQSSKVGLKGIEQAQ